MLYEMLTGRAAFARDTITDTLAAIVDREPDWGALPAETPATVQRLLKRCLEKDPKRRLRDIGDVSVELEDPDPASMAPIEKKRSSLTRRTAAVALAGTVVLVAGAVGALFWQASSSEAQRPTAHVARFTTTIDAPDWVGLDHPTMAWLPDGSGFVYLERNDAGIRLYIRAIDQLQGHPLPGTEGAANPFLSPDGEWLGFFSNGKLKKVSVRGGTPVDVCAVPSLPLGASRSTTGSIVFGSVNGSGLWQVLASGGAPQSLGPSPDVAGSTAEAWPEALPDGKSALYTVMPAGQKPAFVAVRSLVTGERKYLAEGSSAHYMSTGHNCTLS